MIGCWCLQHLEFCNKLCDTLDIGRLTISMGLEVNPEVIVARVEQLVKQEVHVHANEFIRKQIIVLE